MLLIVFVSVTGIVVGIVIVPYLRSIDGWWIHNASSKGNSNESSFHIETAINGFNKSKIIIRCKVGQPADQIAFFLHGESF